MALLPQKVGRLTLVRALENDGVTQSHVGILDDAAGSQVIVRKVLPSLARDPEVRGEIEARIADLVPIRHPGLLPITHTFEQDEALFLAHEWPDAVSMTEVVAWCRDQQEPVPLNFFLHVAVQICNALEGLHGRTGAVTQAPSVLHLQVRPSSIWFTRDGEVLLGNYGLLPSPTFATQTGGFRLKTAYLAPEQTHASARPGTEDDSDGGGRRLSPASDLFSLGAVLYELLVHKPMFEASTPLRTIAKVRRAEVTTQLLEVKEVFPGVDRVLYRALALNPRHRYQRAFVFREDLRGLMAQFSFSNIQDDSRRFLAPLFRGDRRAVDELLPKRPSVPTPPPIDTEPTILGRIDVDAIRRGLSDPRLGEMLEVPIDEEPEDSARTFAAAPTGAFDFPSRGGPIARPVSFTADDPFSDVAPTPAVDQGIRAALRPTAEYPTIKPTEEELEPVDFTVEEIDLEEPFEDEPPTEEAGLPAKPPVSEVSATGEHDPHAETMLLAPPDLPPDPPAGVPSEDDQGTTLLVGAGVTLVVLLSLLVCMGGTLLGAVVSRGSETVEVEPATGRPTRPVP